MSIALHTMATQAEPLCTLSLTAQQRRLLEVCVAWHARVHADPEQRQEFAALTEVLRDERRSGKRET